MTFNDLYNKVEEAYLNAAIKHSGDYTKMGEIDDLEASDAEKVRRALEYISNSESAKEIFQDDADVARELHTQIRNEYNDDDIIKALKLGGEGKKANLYSYKDGWMSIPTKDLILMAKNAGLEPKELIRYLGDKQRVRDLEMIVEGFDPQTGKRNMKDWLQSAYMGVMAPRQKEAIKRGEEPSATDAVLDAGEIALSSLPVGGPTAKIASKVLGKGARGLGSRLGHWATKQGKTLVDAAVVPAATEALDAVVYDDPRNPRSTFNPYDVGVGALTNAAAPWLLRSGLGVFARPVGSRSGLSKTVENLTDDPASNALYKVEEAFNILNDAKNRSNKYTADELQAARDIIVSSEMVKDNPDLAKYAQYLTGEEIWPNRPFMNPVRDKSKEVGKKYKEYLETNPSTVKKNRDVQKEAVQSDMFPSESESFEAAGSNVFATDFLNDPSKWGLTKGGKAGLMNKEKAKALDLNTENLIDPRHAEKSAKELKFKESMKHNTDRGYPRASAFDKEVDRLIRTNPEQFKSGSGLTSGLRSLITNKAAPSVGKSVVPTYGPALESLKPEPDEKQAKIQEYLNDPSVIRMWSEGKFKPREIPGDPLWEAYKIYKQGDK
jgi:hypothetical protein